MTEGGAKEMRRWLASYSCGVYRREEREVGSRSGNEVSTAPGCSNTPGRLSALGG